MCPQSDPYAYLEGVYCCETNKEKVGRKNVASCDGSEIEISSTCFENNQYTPCQAKPCKNYVT